VDCVAEDGTQPIHHAAECGEADAVVCLVQKGADVDAKSDNGLTPIHLATCEDNYSALEALIAMGGM
jgi:ankyrin repeat protein